MSDMNRRAALKTLGALGLGSIAYPCLPTLRGESKLTNQGIPNSLNQSGWELFRTLPTGNVLISPTSIGLALAMTERGAKGQTAQEMRKVLHLENTTLSADPGFATLVNGLQAEKPGRQVRVANRLFGQKNYGFLPEFTTQLKDWFHAPLEEVDFINETEASRLRINGWVEDQTAKMIKDLIPSGVLSSLSRLVLANAIHFKGEWLSPFQKGSTHPAPFEKAPGQMVQVPRMSQKRRFTIRQTEDAEALEMPCKGNDRSVHFILPKTRMGLASVENKLNIESLDKLLFGEAPTEEVQLGLPKFKIESSQTLNQPLAQLGMPTAFSNTSADFSGMNGGKEPLKIDAVLHKAVLVVDELGAEAAAATAVVIGLRSMPAKPPRSFLVDQPFLVAISDKVTRSILFLGRVTEPAKV